MNGIALSVVVAPSSRRCHRSGSQIVRRPSTISAGQNDGDDLEYVTDPAGGKRQSRNEHQEQDRDREALLREHLAQRSERLGADRREASAPSWSLKGSPIPIPVAIATGSQAAHRVPRTANQRSESLPRTRNRRLPSTVPVRGGRCHVPVVSKEQRAEAPRRLFAAGFYGDRSAGARMRVDTRSLIVGV